MIDTTWKMGYQVFKFYKMQQFMKKQFQKLIRSYFY